VERNDHRDGKLKSAVRQRDWKRIHHSPMFWAGVLLFVMAVTIYVLSDNLAWQPRLQ